MPQGETFWNPYRWVTLGDQPVAHAAPGYQHCFQGLSGRLACELEALTPLIVGDGRGEFVRRNNKPFVPATSLKGAVRSLAELVGNAAVPFERGHADPDHAVVRAQTGSGANWQLDIVARTFGYLNRGDVFAGLVRFSDAEEIERAAGAGPWPSFKVSGGQPDPDHRAFYPDRQRRKLYHHQAGAAGLTPPHAGIKEDQKRTVRPAPPGTRFAFRIDFANLREDELNLLLYCLVLEDQVTVTLSRQTLGPGAQEPLTLQGPLRHKLGGCKPQGGGSAHIRVAQMQLRTDPASRYRGQPDPPPLCGQALQDELQRRTQPFRARRDATMQQLRAMLIYAPDDPRGRHVNYPTYQWFLDQKQTADKTPLKPAT